MRIRPQVVEELEGLLLEGLVGVRVPAYLDSILDLQTHNPKSDFKVQWSRLKGALEKEQHMAWWVGLENVLRDWTQHTNLSYLALHSDGGSLKEFRRERASMVSLNIGLEGCYDVCFVFVCRGQACSIVSLRVKVGQTCSAAATASSYGGKVSEQRRQG